MVDNRTLDVKQNIVWWLIEKTALSVSRVHMGHIPCPMDESATGGSLYHKEAKSHHQVIFESAC